jgi:hypothetical protein
MKTFNLKTLTKKIGGAMIAHETLPEPGIYRAAVGNAQLLTSERGSTRLWIQFHAVDEADEITPAVIASDNLFLDGAKQNALVRAADALTRALGIDLDGKLDPASLIGRKCYIRTEHEHYEGRTRSKVRFLDGYPDASTI